MYTLLAHHGFPQPPAEGSVLGASDTWFGPVDQSVKTLLDEHSSDVNAYNGHLGVLRQDNPTFERQRRYDFWFKP